MEPSSVDGDLLAERPSKSLQAARRQELEALANMTVRERVLLARRLGERRCRLMARKPSDGPG